VSGGAGTAGATAGRTPTQNAPLVGRSIHTATPDMTRLLRLPVDRHDAGQAGSYAYPPDRPHAATFYAAQNLSCRVVCGGRCELGIMVRKVLQTVVSVCPYLLNHAILDFDFDRVYGP